ncbi:hypothetical protein AAA799B03_00975 [Marine Group I thaumarchaeote SCGC AAA799-B03]|uniref:Uncharacterized protein n=3 Tax=Marine Group I TaxID=905826 RepID=A0A087S6X2_9ARCH|nr:hypothetical protein AAA799N04_00832 [Marine Group I thaumarchaeote SCGC AAA799-N04]KFM19204.1 hypothetical protein SCCGRSA3_00789 [Marine Group I thaumarchaeote SCGC RSA3]KFM21476.1 hypothetical protein AAA799B03_00975 [Marine Group I thaumarchaeote SCGC AAA799-B03]
MLYEKHSKEFPKHSMVTPTVSNDVELTHETAIKQELLHGNLFDDNIDHFKKTIYREDDNIQRVFLNGLSAYMKNPNNSRLLAPTGEGKTYLTSEISKTFSSSDVIFLASASAQSFKYDFSDYVVMNDDGSLESMREKLTDLETKLASESDSKQKKSLTYQIKQIRSNAYGLVDFSNKWIIFSDSQNFSLWESLKPLLSHDSEYIVHKVTNKLGGKNTTQNIIFRGKPAVTYCSAKDESKHDVTGEIDSRFDTISLHNDKQKYRDSLTLIAKKQGLAGELFDDEVVSKHEQKLACMRTQLLKDQILKYGQKDNPVLNPFMITISEIFPNDSGMRSRQLDRFGQMINLICICNANRRSKVIIGDDEYPIVSINDVLQTTKIIKESPVIPTYKIQFFNDVIRKAIQDLANDSNISKRTEGTIDEKTWITASEISDFAEKTLDKKFGRQKTQETYLKDLEDHGYVESIQDSTNKSRKLYSISSKYADIPASLESTLIDTSTLDESCVKSFLDRYVKHRLSSKNIQIVDESGKSISLGKLASTLCIIDTDMSDSSHKSDSVEASIGIEIFED